MKIDRPRGGERPAHATHDQLLVVRFAAGDTTDAETTAVRELIATCPGCRQLASDLLAIARATADLPQPVRRRDFRISPEQAARLRRPALLRWLTRVSGVGDPRLGGPGRLVGLQRLAGAAVAVGLVMALVTSPAGIPGFATGSATQDATGQSGRGVAGAAAPGLAVNPNAAPASAAIPATSAASAAAPASAAIPAASAASAAAPGEGATSPFAAPASSPAGPLTAAAPPPSPAPTGPTGDSSSAAQPPSPLLALGPAPSAAAAVTRQAQSHAGVPGAGPTVSAWQAWLLLAAAGLAVLLVVRASRRAA